MSGEVVALTEKELFEALWEEAGADFIWRKKGESVLLKMMERGDGVAIYRNEDFGHPELGKRVFVSYGSADAQLETEVPPERLPDIGDQINWRYRLVGYYREGK